MSIFYYSVALFFATNMNLIGRNMYGSILTLEDKQTCAFPKKNYSENDA